MGLLVNELNHIYNTSTANEKVALKNINLEINDGEFIGLIGHSGCGKSTLIMHLNGLLKPSSGSVYFNGEDIFDKDFSLKELRGKVGLVFQNPDYQLFANNVVEEVAFGPNNIGMEKLEAQMSTFEALKLVGIGEELFDYSPLELSGGQKRRVAIASVLAMKPEVLVLDEPTAGLDPVGRDEILDLISNLHKEKNITVILVSHSMEDVARYVDRLVVMNQGEICMDGSCEEVFSRYKELEKIGLSAPQVTYVVEKLSERGIVLPYNAITVQDAKNSILDYLNLGE